jgi:hypothetical protein
MNDKVVTEATVAVATTGDTISTIEKNLEVLPLPSAKE